MNKSGQPTYLNEDKESLVIATANIEGSHGLPFDCHGVAMQFQNVAKAVKSQCGDNEILHKSSMRYFREVIKRVNKKKDEHEYQKIRNSYRVNNGIEIEQHMSFTEWSLASLNHVPQYSCHVQGPETTRESSSITFDPKPYLSIFSATPDITTNRTGPYSQATSSSAWPARHPTFSIARVELRRYWILS